MRQRPAAPLRENDQPARGRDRAAGPAGAPSLISVLQRTAGNAAVARIAPRANDLGGLLTRLTMVAGTGPASAAVEELRAAIATDPELGAVAAEALTAESERQLGLPLDAALNLAPAPVQRVPVVQRALLEALSGAVLNGAAAIWRLAGRVVTAVAGIVRGNGGAPALITDLESGTQTPLANAPAPAPRKAVHQLIQGQDKIAHIGDSVVNLGTTACGLVLLFSTSKVGCFHWPFMEDQPQHFQTLQRIIVALGEPVSQVIVVTNDYPQNFTDNQIAGYRDVAVKIGQAATAGVTYYVTAGKIRDDPWVTLTPTGVTAIGATLRTIALTP